MALQTVRKATSGELFSAPCLKKLDEMELRRGEINEKELQEDAEGKKDDPSGDVKRGRQAA